MCNCVHVFVTGPNISEEIDNFMKVFLVSHCSRHLSFGGGGSKQLRDRRQTIRVGVHFRVGPHRFGQL